MVTIIANPCSRPAIPRVVDSGLISKHLNERFIQKFGISYHSRMRVYIVKECTDYDEEYVENEMIDVGNDDALVVENLFMHAKD